MFMYGFCVGICRGIILVLTGFWNDCFLKPKKYPKYTNGTEIPNHKSNKPIIVENGKLPLDPVFQMKKFKKKQVLFKDNYIIMNNTREFRYKQKNDPGE